MRLILSVCSGMATDAVTTEADRRFDLFLRALGVELPAYGDTETYREARGAYVLRVREDYIGQDGVDAEFALVDMSKPWRTADKVREGVTFVAAAVPAKRYYASYSPQGGGAAKDWDGSVDSDHTPEWAKAANG